MKHLNKLITLVLALALSFTLPAQDVHFSQYNAAPLMLNPAMTGNFNCTFRGGLNYRNQWNSVASPYVTYSAFFDMPLSMISGFDDGDVIGAGIYLFNDRTGEGTLTNLSAVLSLAYHKALGNDAQHRLSLGVGLGFMQKRLDQANLLWGNQWTGDGFDPNQSSGENFSGNSFGNFNLDVGLMFKSTTFEDRLYYEAGVSAFHLTSPTEAFLVTSNPDDSKLGMRYAAHGKAIFSVSDNFRIQPSFLYQTQSKATEILAGAQFGYVIDAGTFQAVVGAGAQYRFDDAIIPVINFDYQNFRFGFSYDVTTSSLKEAASSVSAFELSLTYVACVIPIVPKEYEMPCPRY
jgi:type IX secretion system PorP/SprF family membrane protein